MLTCSAHPDSHSLPYAFDGKTYERKESSTTHEQAGTFIVRLWSKHAARDKSDIFSRQQQILALLKHEPLAPRNILLLLEEDITDRTLRSELQLLRQKGLIAKINRHYGLK